MTPVLCIDGPSGAGKGTLGRILANRLGFSLLDSGALYRLTALAAQQQGVDIQQPEAVAQVAYHLAVNFVPQSDATHIYLNQQDVTRAIRTEAIGLLASQVAAYPPVRQALLARQRAFAQGAGLVADGRDMGTIVFPQAPLKIFLTATAAARAERRLLQLQQAGQQPNLAQITADIEARDHQDTHRATAPLVPAADAVVLDSTHLTIAQGVEHILSLWQQRGGHVC